ncbi:uncharacterized protein ACBT57_012913 [Dama dama]
MEGGSPARVSQPRPPGSPSPNGAIGSERTRSGATGSAPQACALAATPRSTTGPSPGSRHALPQAGGWRGCVEGDGLLGRDRSTRTASRRELAPGKHAPLGGIGLKGERVTRESGGRPRWGWAGPREGRVAPPQFFSPKGETQRQAAGSCHCRVRPDRRPHRRGRDRRSCSRAPLTTACQRGRKGRPSRRTKAATDCPRAWGPRPPPGVTGELDTSDSAAGLFWSLETRPHDPEAGAQGGGGARRVTLERVRLRARGTGDCFAVGNGFSPRCWGIAACLCRGKNDRAPLHAGRRGASARAGRRGNWKSDWTRIRLTLTERFEEEKEAKSINSF